MKFVFWLWTFEGFATFFCDEFEANFLVFAHLEVLRCRLKLFYSKNLEKSSSQNPRKIKFPFNLRRNSICGFELPSNKKFESLNEIKTTKFSIFLLELKLENWFPFQPFDEAVIELFLFSFLRLRCFHFCCRKSFSFSSLYDARKFSIFHQFSALRRICEFSPSIIHIPSYFGLNTERNWKRFSDFIFFSMWTRWKCGFSAPTSALVWKTRRKNRFLSKSRRWNRNQLKRWIDVNHRKLV